jgi:hypothetical protein
VYSCSCGWYCEVAETDRNVSNEASSAVVYAMGGAVFRSHRSPEVVANRDSGKARIAGTHAVPSAGVGMGSPQGV